MALAPVKNCSMRIDPDFITLSVPNPDNPEHPEVTAKAETEVVLAEIFGATKHTITHPLGTLPRGMRYISSDRSLYSLEYQPGPVSLFLPKRMAANPPDRFVTVYMPKYFISVKFNDEFSSIIGAAISISYDYNYTVNDPVQRLFGMNSFELKAVPTPNIGSVFPTVGAFLSTLAERVLSHSFSFLGEDELDWSQGHPSLPDQYTPEIAEKMSFIEFWATQGELVYDWTFTDPPRSTLAEIMYLNEDDMGGIDFDKMSYPETIATIMSLVVKHNKLKQIKQAEKALAAAVESWRSWRKTNYGISLDTTTPFPLFTANDSALISLT